MEQSQPNAGPHQLSRTMNNNDHHLEQSGTTSILQLGDTASSSNTFEVQEIPAGFFSESGAVVIDSGISPFFDNIESGQVIFKGILDHNGALVLDPAQFAALIGSVQIEHTAGSSHHRDILPLPATYSLGQHHINPTLPLPLTPLNQNNKLNTTLSSLVSGIQEGFRTSIPSEPPMIQTLSSINALPTIRTVPSKRDTTTTTTSIPKLISATEIANDSRISVVAAHSSSNDGDKAPSFSTEIENQQPQRFTEPPVGKGPYRCQECDKVFLKWPHFKRHKTEHLDMKVFRCPLCSMSFNFEINLKLHESIHEAEISGCLECQLCPAKFSRLASLRSHVRVHEKEENQVCPECGDEFATKARLDTHLEEHKTTKSLVHRCKLCGKTFTHAALLKEHSKEHFAVRNQLKLLHTRKKRPNQIGKPSSTDSGVHDLSTRSSRSKESKKKLLCSVCAKRFEKPSQLTRHMRIHTGEKPYSCNQCERSFNQKNTLDSHILSMHEKLKPHICHLCNCQFSQRGNLRAHVMKVHIHPGNGEQCFKCEDCSCIFRKLASLNTHSAKVHAKTKQFPESVDNNVEPSIMFIGMPPILPSLISTSTQQAELSPQIVFSPSTDTFSSELPTITEVSLVHEFDGVRTAHTVKVKRVGQEKVHLCPYDCSKSFKKPSDLIRHIRIHTQERPYVCTICKKSFSVKSTLNIHMKIHSEQKDWECHVCHKRFTVLNSLRSHERLHTGAKPFPCAQCGKWFRTTSQRRVHAKVHSRNAQGLTGKRRLLRIGDTEPKIDLPDPLKITSDGLVRVPNRATQTIVTEDSDLELKCRPYRCSLCPCGFKKSSHLKQHQRSHTGERPYKCFQCFRSFISSGVLKNHIKTHEGVRAFKCKQCQLSFTTKGSLTRHMATHTEERSFVCPYCHKAFKTSVACRKHIKTHRSEFVALHTRADSEGDKNATDQIDITQPQNEDLLGGRVEDIYDDANTFPQEVNPMLPECSNQNMSANSNQEEQQMQGISNLDNVHLGGTGTASQQIHYSVVSSDHTVMEETVNQISLSEGQVFDGSIYTLQGSDHIDLPVSLASLLPMSSTTQPSQPQTHSTIFTQPATFVRVETCSESIHNSIVSAHEPDVPSEVETVQTVISSEDCDSEINKIRDKSRPISEQIYNQMQTAASTEMQVNMTELLINNFSELEKGKINICTHCGRGFKKRSDLVRHTRIHTGEKPFRCNVCGKSFRVKSTREAHMRIHEGGKTVACHVCNNLFSTKSSLRVHLRLHTGSRPYKCPHCDRHFRTSGHRKAHVSSHFKSSKNQPINSQSTNPFIRKHSSVLPPVQTIKEKIGISEPVPVQVNEDHHQTVYSINTGEQHNNLQDPVQIIGSLQMSLDGSQVQNIQLGGLDLSTLQISDELLQSLGSVIFVAPHTNQIITAADLANVNLLGSGVTIRTDMEAEHQQVIQDVVMNKQPSSMLTGKDVHVGGAITQHQMRTSVVSMSDLEQTFQTDSNLMGFTNFSTSNVINNSPMLSSTSTTVSPPNKNSTEAKVFNNPSDSTVLPLSNKQCPTCGKTFAKPSLLNRHMSVHTGLKPYKCDVCSSSFNQKNSLDAHKYTHMTENEKPFQCTSCPFKTVVKTALKKHISRAHPETNIDDMLNASSSIAGT